MGGGPNAEAMRRMVEAYLRGDVEGVLAEMDPDIELHPLPDVADEPYVGHEGIRRFFEEESGAWDELSFDVRRIVVNGDCVAMLGRYRSRRDGTIRDSPAAWAGDLRDGRLVCLESFLSWDDALERCGLLDAEAAAS